MGGLCGVRVALLFASAAPLGASTPIANKIDNASNLVLAARLSGKSYKAVLKVATEAQRRRLSEEAEEYPSTPTETAIFAQRNTPMTDVISFSTKLWPTYEGGWIYYGVDDARIFKLYVVQRACPLSSADPASCYLGTEQDGHLTGTPFNHIDSDTTDAKMQLVRAAGLSESGNYPVTGQACAGEREDGEGFGLSLGTWPKGGDTTGNTEDNLCFYNNADEIDPTSCSWTSSSPAYLRPMPSHAEAQDLDNPGSTVEYDYTFEVCVRPGVCKPDDFDCINAYTVVGVGNVAGVDARQRIGFQMNCIENPRAAGCAETLPAAGTDCGLNPEASGCNLNRIFYPKQLPLRGAGTVDSVYNLPADGPFWPCPLGADGRQQNCKTYSRPEPESLQESLDVYVTISDLQINSVSLMSYEKFSVELKYDATWSSRYAVHPCSINLYDDGVGVGVKGKTVPSHRWWKPTPIADGGSTAVKHSENLKVFRSNLLDNNFPADLVNTPCSKPSFGSTSEPECPWPMQLFLQDKIVVEATFESDWNLARFPFDTQTLTGQIMLVSNTKFEGDKDFVHIVYSKPGEGGWVAEDPSTYSPGGSRLDSLFPGFSWQPKSARLTASVPEWPQAPQCLAYPHLCITFEVRMQRQSTAIIFKVLLPVLVNALLAILSSRASSSTRLKIIALSTVAAAAMLNPSFLGLPQGVDGVPFVMALVIGHLGITFCMLLATGFIVEKHFAIIEKTREFKKMRRPMLVTEWKGAFALKEEIESQLYGWASANMEENKDSSMKVEGIDAVEIVTGGDRNKKESESDVGTMPPTSPPLSPSAQTQARITSPRPDSKYSESTLVAKMRTKKGLRWRNFMRTGSVSVTPGPDAAEAGKKERPRAVNEPLALLTKAVLALPPLMHYAVQSTHDTPTDPTGNGKMAAQDWMLPIEKKLKAQSLRIDRYLRMLVPPAYLMMWSILSLVYFAGNE